MGEIYMKLEIEMQIFVQNLTYCKAEMELKLLFQWSYQNRRTITNLLN